MSIYIWGIVGEFARRSKRAPRNCGLLFFTRKLIGLLIVMAQIFM